MATPKRDRPQLPPGYITRAPKGMLSWASVQRMLRTARYLWISTTGADGAPHLVEQWCAWVDDTLYFEGSDRTRWARNLARDPRLRQTVMSCHDEDVRIVVELRRRSPVS